MIGTTTLTSLLAEKIIKQLYNMQKYLNFSLYHFLWPFLSFAIVSTQKREQDHYFVLGTTEVIKGELRS